MHPSQAVVSHSSRPQHHHHHDDYEDERQRPPPYNPDDYDYSKSKGHPHPQQLGFEKVDHQPHGMRGFTQSAPQQSSVPHTQQPAMGPAYQQYQQPPTAPLNSVVITNQPYSMSAQNLTMLRGLPHHATTVTCQNCQSVVSTKVDHHASCKTHCWAACLFVFLCWPCMCIPYCKDSCRTANHYCTRCDSFLGNSHNA